MMIGELHMKSVKAMDRPIAKINFWSKYVNQKSQDFRIYKTNDAIVSQVFFCCRWSNTHSNIAKKIINHISSKTSHINKIRCAYWAYADRAGLLSIRFYFGAQQLQFYTHFNSIKIGRQKICSQFGRGHKTRKLNFSLRQFDARIINSK